MNLPLTKLLDFDNDSSAPGHHPSPALKGNFLSTEEFFNQSLRVYSSHSNVRGIPFIGDGFKEAQRKALWGMLDRGETAGLISVERVSASCAAVTGYHHGIGSMQSTIVGLAQTFAGSNNVPLLVADGQFGSRLSHSASAPRYIETKLHENFRKIFSKEDDCILEQRRVGELAIEPKYFIPLLPVVLLNGAEGMGTGHATHIFSYDPMILKNTIMRVLDAKPIPDHQIIPYWEGFKGQVTREPLTGQVMINGDLTVISTTEIRITELPVGVQSDQYEKHLFALEDQGKIKSFKNASDDTGFEFIVKVPRLTSALPLDQLRGIFKLIARDSENLTVWNPHGEIQKYESVEKLIVDFVKWRLERFADRLAKQIILAKEQISWYEEIIHFITFYLSRSTEFRNTSKKELLELLTLNGFQHPERLLSMSIWTLTKDHADDAINKLEREQRKLLTLENDTPKKLYQRELNHLKL